MDRHTVTQLIAMVVVLAIGMRWLPAGEERSKLGVGDPWRTIAMDREIVRLGGDSDAAVAFLRFRPPTTKPKTMMEMQRSKQSEDWLGKLKAVRDLRRGSGPDDVVEFQGVPRNEVWALTYRLYPLPATPWTLEMGSRFGEALREDTTVFPLGLDVDKFQRSVKQMKDGAAKRLGLRPGETVPDSALPEWARKAFAQNVRADLLEQAAAWDAPRTAQRTRKARDDGADGDAP